ncbi:hypothetical protein PoB_002168000 [Plakobranchus ocellatus]|uniref:Uncharacterized protein n=1 Tax=Plakobranchus ocellatus TaxID=259542 RepID=A0AAV3ZJ70_9GAST|nr:hypothetical protein PoB_002168000 [Plakobranchus ocellatus]
MFAARIILTLVALAIPLYAFDGCVFDGTRLEIGEIKDLGSCLGGVKCLGYDDVEFTDPPADCTTKRAVDGQTGCLFDGKVYRRGQKIVIANCMAQYTCMGNNNLGEYKQLGRRSGGSSGRAVGYYPRGPGFDSQSGPSQIFIAPLCPPSTKWVARSLKIRRK